MLVDPTLGDGPSRLVRARIAEGVRRALGRDVDQGGLEYWTKAVQGGAELSDVARGFLASLEGRSLYGS
ncbi:MAG: DUF4214 domain-containing protein, partial [Steroidobacteraceae bacterium]